jgi:hypothetical protein
VNAAVKLDPATAEDVRKDVAAYLAAVRAELSDLPANHRDALIDDLGEHLGEIAVELDGPLADRLGAPADYARDLRVSAGFDPATAPAPWWRGLLGPGARQALGAAAHFVDSLRPTWVLVRALLAGYLLVTVLERVVTVPYSLHWLAPLGVAVVLVAAVAGSLRLDRWERARTRPAWVRALLAVASIVLAVVGASIVLGQRVDGSDASDASGSQAVTSNGSMGPDGRPPSDLSHVTNIVVYDANGKALHDVRLYDQGGNPLVLGDPWYGVDGITRTTVTTTDGTVSSNVYPIEWKVARPTADGATVAEDPTTLAQELANVPPTTVRPLLVAPAR